MRSGWEQQLRRAPVLRDLEEPELRRLAELFAEASVDAGEVVFDEASAGEALYLIRDGGILLCRGADRIRLGPGDHFGEVGLSSGLTSPSTAQALEPSRLLRIAKSDLLGFLRIHPTLALKLHSASIRRADSGKAPVRVRRAHQRFPVASPTTLLLRDGILYEVVVENVSLSGLRLGGAPAEWQPKQPVRFHLAIGDGYIELGGEVVWRRGETVGITFTGQSRGHDAKIRWALRQLAK